MRTIRYPNVLKGAAGASMAVLILTGCSSKSTPAASSQSTAAAPAASGAAAAVSAASVMTASGSPGTFLTDSAGKTLYLWVADTSATSTCTGQCATFWPPLLTSGAPTATGAAKTSLLGTTKRTDGTTQVTYAGHPLYYFAEDKAAGSVSGQGSDGFGAKWWVVNPAGTAITAAAGASAPSASSAGY